MKIVENVCYSFVFLGFVILGCLIVRIGHLEVRDRKWFCDLTKFLRESMSMFVTGILGLPDLVFVAFGFAFMYIIERIPFLRRLVSKY